MIVGLTTLAVTLTLCSVPNTLLGVACLARGGQAFQLVWICAIFINSTWLKNSSGSTFSENILGEVSAFPLGKWL